VNVAFEIGHTDAQPEALVEVCGEAVQEVARRVVALMDERVVTVHDFDVGVTLVERREIRIEGPEIRKGCSNVGQKLGRMRAVQIAHCGREHHDVSG
jgi:hypothetical protein